MMLFSVLMANYNNSRFIGNAIKSVLQQTYKHWEIVVVDDGSTDHFDEFMDEFKDDNRIKIYKNEKNEGCAFTKAKCCKLACGDILAFLDTDDYLHPDALSIMIDLHKAKPECSIIHSTHYICNSDMNVVRIAEYPKALPENTPFLLLGDGSIHHFATFKKSSYDKTEGITPIRKKDLAMDQDLYYKLEEVGEVYFINQPLYYYRIHAGSISNWGNEYKSTNAHYYIIEEACKRRINNLSISNTPASKSMIKRYKTRYHKIRIFSSYRSKSWGSFLQSLMLFPIVGGAENLISYIKKLPKGGMSMIRHSLMGNYKINDF